jgi:Domain of unknown function (DUF4258)
MKIRIDPHARSRMPIRGISPQEVELVLQHGASTLARGGRKAKEMVFPYSANWLGRIYPEKKVRVVYIEEEEEIVVVTALAYYGRWS